MVIDFHVHTTQGSADSNLNPLAMIDQAKTIGLDGICVTEHDYTWSNPEIEEHAKQQGIVLFHGIEVTTEWGHIGAFGLDQYVGGIYKVRELRRVINDVGGFLIANHPFRYKLDPRFQFIHKTPPLDLNNPAAATALEIFSFVDEIEVVNGACSEQENLFAHRVAQHLGRKGIGGSDSHSAPSLGCAMTVLERPVATVHELITELKAGRYHPGQGLNTGQARAFP
jgi:predicted metal-dependent phosphoesterase TrpH